MKNWAVDEKKFDESSVKYQVWRLEQLINFGLDGEKIDLKLLSKHWDQLNIDADKKDYLEFLLKRINA